MKFSKREKQIFYLCLAVILIMILEQLVFRPLGNKLADLNQEINSREVGLMKGLLIDGQREHILQEYKSYEGYLKVKGSDEEAIAEFLREIEKLSRESAISLLDIKPQSTNKRTIFKEYIIEVRAEAPMKGMIDFLYRLNNSFLLIKVEKLVLNLKEENNDILKINMLISGIVL